MDSKNVYLVWAITIHAVFAALCFIVPGEWLNVTSAASVTGSSLVFAAAWASTMAWVVRRNEVGGGQIVLIGNWMIAAGLACWGLYAIAWFIADRPESWGHYPVLAYIRFFTATGVVLLLVSPGARPDGFVLPRWSIVVVGGMIILIVGIVLGIGIANQAESAMKPALPWR